MKQTFLIVFINLNIIVQSCTNINCNRSEINSSRWSTVFSLVYCAYFLTCSHFSHTGLIRVITSILCIYLFGIYDAPQVIGTGGSSTMKSDFFWNCYSIIFFNFRAKKIPIIVRRYLPDLSYEDWSIDELTITDWSFYSKKILFFVLYIFFLLLTRKTCLHLKNQKCASHKKVHLLLDFTLYVALSHFRQFLVLSRDPTYN